MDHQEIRNILLGALQEAKGEKFDLSGINENSHLVNDLDLDSLDMIETVWEIEEKLGVTIREDQFRSLNTVGDVMKLIETLIREKESGGAAKAASA